MICADCGERVSDDSRDDNRYRGCGPCGWRMHHHCWVERLALGDLPCPSEVEEWERTVWVEVEGRTPTGRRKRRRTIQTVQSPRYLDGHGDIMGMLGQWHC